jgi:hypothetical protein
VIAKDHDFATHDEIDALAWIGSISDDIAQAIDFGNLVLPDILKDGLESLQIAMDIANQRFHNAGLQGATPRTDFPPFIKCTSQMKKVSSRGQQSVCGIAVKIAGILLVVAIPTQNFRGQALRG